MPSTASTTYSASKPTSFLPQQKLVRKTRQGAKVTKTYDIAQTPYQRSLTHTEVDIADKAALTEQYTTLNPAAIQRDILALSHALGRLVTTPDLPSQIHPTTAQLLLKAGVHTRGNDSRYAGNLT